MQSTVRLDDGSELVFEQDVQAIHTMPYSVYDPDWVVTDMLGHTHFNDNGNFPTLKANWLIGGCGVCNDVHEEGEILDYYECKVCGLEIKPGTKTVGGGIEHIVGQRSYYLRNVPVADEDLERLIAENAQLRVEGGLDGRTRFTLEYKALTEEEATALMKDAMNKRLSRG
jgi:hypothetical protein